MTISFRRFCDDETGAVTIDWVVLTAALIGIGMAILGPIAFETDNLAVTIGGYVTDVPVGAAGNN